MTDAPMMIASMGDTPESSSYKKSKRSNPLPYKKALGTLLSEGHDLEDAQGLLAEIWEDASKPVEDGGFEVPSLSPADEELFQAFRWFGTLQGSHTMFVRTGSAQTYVLTEDPMLSATAIEINGKETLYTWMDRTYRAMLCDGRIRYALPEDGSRAMVPTLSEYWDDKKALWERDPAYRLSKLPVEISKDEDEPAFLHVKLDDLVEGETPSWDGWLSGMPEPCRVVFKAWIWSIFEPTNKGRQCVWIRDGGYSGKSSVGRALNNFMRGVGVGSVSHGSLSNQFAFASVYGRRLLVYGDNKNSRLLSSGVVHSILGGDAVQIERKGQDPFSAIVHAKLLVFSNVFPEVDIYARNEVSRILYIPLGEPAAEVMAKYCVVQDGKVVRRRDGTPVFKGGRLSEELEAEMIPFLYQCREAYHELCPTGQEIVVPDDMYALLERDCTSPEQMEIEAFAHDWLVRDKGSMTPVRDVKDKWGDKKSRFDWANLRRWLTDKWGVQTEVVDGMQYFRGLTLEKA